MTLPVMVSVQPLKETQTPNSGCLWLAEAEIDGRRFEALSRHGAPNELARQLVAAGIADRPMVIRCQGLAGTMTWRSLHTAAAWTYKEGDRPLRRVRYKARPEIAFSCMRSGQKEGESRRDRSLQRSTLTEAS
jgi:hypothetical protein